MLLVPDRAPLQATLIDAIARGAALGMPLIARRWTRDNVAFGTLVDDDSLDEPFSPAIDRSALEGLLAESGVPVRATSVVAEAIGHREEVVDLGATTLGDERPPTLFEQHALVDVLGEELAALLPIDRVRIARRSLRAPALNHCQLDALGVAHVRLLDTNGRTLAGRTHALVHELGHALIGVARHEGRSYAAPYGQPDFARFLSPRTFDQTIDEEALVRAIADAWLLRRPGVSWSRTWPGAVDHAAKDLDEGDLAAFVRFRLAQGLGMPFSPVTVRAKGSVGSFR